GARAVGIGLVLVDVPGSEHLIDDKLAVAANLDLAVGQLFVDEVAEELHQGRVFGEIVCVGPVGGATAIPDGFQICFLASMTATQKARVAPGFTGSQAPSKYPTNSPCIDKPPSFAPRRVVSFKHFNCLAGGRYLTPLDVVEHIPEPVADPPGAHANLGRAFATVDASSKRVSVNTV